MNKADILALADRVDRPTPLSFWTGEMPDPEREKLIATAIRQMGESHD